MSDQMIEKLKILYQKSGMGENFDSDLAKGVVAKIEISNDTFHYSDYARISTSVYAVDSHKYQYFIFKPGYYYKNNKLQCTDKKGNLALKSNNNLCK